MLFLFLDGFLTRLWSVESILIERININLLLKSEGEFKRLKAHSLLRGFVKPELYASANW